MTKCANYVLDEVVFCTDEFSADSFFFFKQIQFCLKNDLQSRLQLNRQGELNCLHLRHGYM